MRGINRRLARLESKLNAVGDFSAVFYAADWAAWERGDRPTDDRLKRVYRDIEACVESSHVMYVMPDNGRSEYCPLRRGPSLKWLAEHKD